VSENLFKRVITSIILLSLLFFVNFSHQIIFIIFILILGLIVCFETNKIFLKLISQHSSRANYTTKKFNLNLLILNLITFCYVFFIFCNFSYEIHRLEGSIFFLYVICICFFTDIGGYVFGNIIGGRKLTKISPNKTISGTIGSFIFSIIPLIIFFILGYLDIEFSLKNITFCLLISVISQLGDLSVSYLKRKAKIKDTGNILPGHGGVLDRIDGIIFAVPFSYFLIKFF
tara:strand:+ start:1222 stop:1911 length:690 start_codon:yes stop_codon:yes gene_type:complete